MQALLDASRAMTAVFDRDGTIIAVNCGLDRRRPPGRGQPRRGRDRSRLCRGDAPRCGHLRGRRRCRRRCGGRPRWSGPTFEWDYDVTEADGTLRAFMVSVAPMPGEQGGAFATHTDITTRKVMERQLAHQASHDPLTGLRTRRRVEQELEPALARSVVTGRPVAAVIVDLDRFKDVNDTLGHEAGDQVLVQMAAPPARVHGGDHHRAPGRRRVRADRAGRARPGRAGPTRRGPRPGHHHAPAPGRSRAVLRGQHRHRAVIGHRAGPGRWRPTCCVPRTRPCTGPRPAGATASSPTTRGCAPTWAGGCRSPPG